MVEVHDALEGCDLVLLMMDVMQRLDPRDEFALGMIKGSKARVFLVLNKIDLLRTKSRLLPLIQEYKRLYQFAEIIPISALKQEGLELLLKAIVSSLPAGQAFFPADQLTDQPARFMAAEIVRERILLETQQELPYATAVVVDAFEESAKLTRISATIYCEREGQKAILIGKKGHMLRKIGTSARLQIERMLGTKVFLELFVKVQSNWRKSPRFVHELDWRRQLEQLTSFRTPRL